MGSESMRGGGWWVVGTPGGRLDWRCAEVCSCEGEGACTVHTASGLVVWWSGAMEELHAAGSHSAGTHSLHWASGHAIKPSHDLSLDDVFLPPNM